MDSYLELAKLYSQAPEDLAFSARPKAPVRPDVRRRRLSPRTLTRWRG